MTRFSGTRPTEVPIRRVAFAVGLLITLAGAVVLAVPASVLALAKHSVTPSQLYGSAAIRLGMGVLFVVVAPVCRVPGLLRVLGGIALVAGVGTLFVGVDRSQAIADWVSRQGLGVVRLLAVVPLALGISILYASAPARRAQIVE